MKVVGLISGGKDSCYAMMRCIEQGHEIVALANLCPVDDSVDDLDSYMYQTVGHQVIVSISQCMGLPLFRRRIQGRSRAQELRYSLTEGDEVEDLFLLLREVQKQYPSLNGVSSGAIASDYQRMRVENVCTRLGLVSLAFLWKEKQASLLQQMIASGIHAIIVKVAALGLEPDKHLGKDLAVLEPHLARLADLYGVNVCGEGGEYETLTLDCPLYKYFKIVLDEFSVSLQSPGTIAPVAVLHPLRFHLEQKLKDDLAELQIASPQVIEVQGSAALSDIDEDLNRQFHGVMKKSPLTSVDSKTYNYWTGIIEQSLGFLTISFTLEAKEKGKGVDWEVDLALSAVESELAGHGIGWEDVLYVHLYLANMNSFVKANKVYMNHITEKQCIRGVPSRSTVEAPFADRESGGISVEVIASKCQSKKVLHVQSISSWAPSCIGPYSQATLHKGILYMAGQLGLDPATMGLVLGGPGAEMEQALRNCEAVAQAFSYSVASCALSVLIYVSSSLDSKGRQSVEDTLEAFIANGVEETSSKDAAHKPLALFVLVPALPKWALVEVEPLVCISDSVEEPAVVHIFMQEDEAYVSKEAPRNWFLSSCQGSVSVGEACRGIASFQGHSSCLETFSLAMQSGFMNLNALLEKACLSWDHIAAWRVYFVAGAISRDALHQIFTESFDRFSMSRPSKVNAVQPLFIPVLGLGHNSRMEELVCFDILALGR